MAVIRSMEALWKHRIYYAMRGESPTPPVPQQIQEAINALNEQVGFTLFAPLPDDKSTLPRALFHLDAGKSCSPIGQQATQPQAIMLKPASPRRTILHEMLHCAGFEHEQFHRLFPWQRHDLPDVTDLNQKALSEEVLLKAKPPVLPGEDPLQKFRERLAKGQVSLELGEKPKNTTSLVEKLKDPVNKKIYQVLELRNGPEYANAYLKDLKAKQDSVISLTEFCDFDSIMMYSDFFQAVKTAQKTYNDLPFLAVTDGKCEKLSTGDVDQIQNLYRQRCST